MPVIAVRSLLVKASLILILQSSQIVVHVHVRLPKRATKGPFRQRGGDEGFSNKLIFYEEQHAHN